MWGQHPNGRPSTVCTVGLFSAYDDVLVQRMLFIPVMHIVAVEIY